MFNPTTSQQHDEIMLSKGNMVSVCSVLITGACWSIRQEALLLVGQQLEKCGRFSGDLMKDLPVQCKQLVIQLIKGGCSGDQCLKYQGANKFLVGAKLPRFDFG